MEIHADHILSPRSGDYRSRLAAWISGEKGFVILVTLAGAILRFAWLSWPTLWNDEVMTYSRVCGTHRQMLDILRDDAFGPLHYEIYWWLGRVFTLTPAVMRLVPAIAGTLMIPAMYHLGRELFGRPVARLACVFAACSAFLLAYSRDAKMYMELWLAITVHVACLMTDLRSGLPGKGARVWIWIGWFGAGTAAVWLHALGFFIVPLDIAIVLLHPKTNVSRTAIVLLSLLAIVVAPLRYIIGFTRVAAAVQRHGWDPAGITWVNERAAGHTPQALLADSASSFAFGFSWIEQPNGRSVLSGPMMIIAACVTAAIGIVLGWSLILRRRASNDMAGTLDREAFANCKGVFLLSMWIVIPVYATYRISSTHSQALGGSIRGLFQAPLHVWLAGSLGFAAAYRAASTRRGRSMLTALLVPLIAITIGLPIIRAFLLDSSSPVRLPAWLHPDISWSLSAIATLACIIPLASMQCETTFPNRLSKCLGMAAVAGSLLALCAVVDAVATVLPRNALWMPRYLGFVYPAVLVASAALLLRVRWSAIRWAAVGGLLAVNLAMAGAHLFVSSEPPLDRVAADVVSSLAPASRMLVYTPDTSRTFGPNAMGSIGNTCGLYYLVMASEKQLTPHQFREQAIHIHFPLRVNADPVAIRRDARSEPDANRLILWERVDEVDRPSRDVEFRALLPQWRLNSTDVYTVRSFWNWGYHYRYRRRLYVRDAG